jgi:predicted O-methyltransferase YrrM
VPIVGRATGALLELLCRLVRPSLIVELGTAAGYSGLWLLRGWPAARLVTFEVDPILADQARRTFAAAGLASRVTVREENAVEGLETIRRGSAGLVFNDALNGLAG